MPSIIPGYIYTLFASIIVGTIVITSCGLVTVNLKSAAEEQQLSNIADYVATKCMELAAAPPANNLTMSISIDVPPLIGNQIYYVEVQNDSSRAWVRAGFEKSSAGTGRQIAYIPSNLAASGFYVSSYGPAFIQYSTNETGSYLTLHGGT